jgi:hypothetical protein
LNDCLRHRLDLARPRSVDDVIRSKFQLTAALRAEHELHEWKATETAWSHSADPASGPFEFCYDYQRADLTVRGPSFYELDGGRAGTVIYTASGMAAISAVLLASAQIVEEADILVLPGSYGETLELIRGYVPHLRLVALRLPLGDAFARTNSPRILLLDSCSVAGAFEAEQRSVIVLPPLQRVGRTRDLRRANAQRRSLQSMRERRPRGRIAAHFVQQQGRMPGEKRQHLALERRVAQGHAAQMREIDDLIGGKLLGHAAVMTAPCEPWVNSEAARPEHG